VKIYATQMQAVDAYGTLLSPSPDTSRHACWRPQKK